MLPKQPVQVLQPVAETTKTVTLFIVALTLIVIFIVQQSDLNMNPEVSIPSTDG